MAKQGAWLDNKTVVVSGASGGIGAGLAEKFIKEHDCYVIGIGRSEEKMKKVVESLGPDARFMDTLNRLFPVAGSTLFSTFMKLPHLDLFREVFRD